MYGGIVVPQNPAYWNKLLSGEDVFAGDRYQRGAGLGALLKGLVRLILPVAKTVGKQAIRTGVKVVKDVAKGKTLQDATIDRVSEGLTEMVEPKRKATKRKPAKRRRQPAAKRRRVQRGKGVGKRPTGGTKAINTLRPRAKRQSKKKKQQRSDTFGFY